MTIRLQVSPPFRDEETFITLSGGHEDEVANILVSRLLSIDYEVLLENDEEDFIPYEEHEE
jgi:hypothetical protein